MKQTRKEIEANLRNKICKNYTSKIDDLNARLKKLEEELIAERHKRHEVEDKYNEMKEKFGQYEDWNRRLQEFMDMSEEDRKTALAEMKASAQANEKMAKLADMCKHFMSPLFY